MSRTNFLAALAAILLVPPSLAAQHAHGAGDAHDPALHAQVEAVRAATARYRDLEAARRDGYRPFGDDEGPLMGRHWYRRDLVGEPFDLRRPSTLQYATIGGQAVLVGVAYTVYRRPGEPEPAGFAGESDRWHTHDVVRLARAAVRDRPLARLIVDRRIERGKVGPGDGRTLLTMVHAWVWLDNPDGVFAEKHRALPYLRAGLPAEWAAGASEAAAEGVALLAPGACESEVRRTDRLARLEGGQERELRAACDRRAATVRSALDGRSAERLNAAAEEEWRGYLVDRARILNSEQRERMARILDAAVEGHVM